MLEETCNRIKLGLVQAQEYIIVSSLNNFLVIPLYNRKHIFYHVSGKAMSYDVYVYVMHQNVHYSDYDSDSTNRKTTISNKSHYLFTFMLCKAYIAQYFANCRFLNRIPGYGSTIDNNI